MDPMDKMPEERVGTVTMIRRRAAEMEQLATACEAEAVEAEETVQRLRTRAERLREFALEYRFAAHALEQAPPAALGKDES